MTDRTSKTVTAEHEQALKWARQQNFTSVSARYAKLCAEAYDIARSAVETFGERRLMATRGLLDRAIQVMTEFHAEFEPDDSPELRPTTSVHAFKDFVDRHARLMYERAQLDKGLPEEPARELTLLDFGYAPGNYTFKCHDCGQEAVGDKRALRCETCAAQALRENRRGAVKAAVVTNECTHEFRPIDSSGQRVCIYCNVRQEKAREHHPRCELMQPHGHEPPKCTCSGLNGNGDV